MSEITGFKGLPLAEQNTRTSYWYVAQVFGGIGFACLAMWIGWLIWGPDNINVSFGLFVGMFGGFMLSYGFSQDNDKYYTVPERWNGNWFWHVNKDGQVTEALPGTTHKCLEIFSLASNEVVTLQSIVRQSPEGKVLENHRIRLRFKELNAQAVTSFLNWYADHSDANRLAPTDRFEKDLEREAKRTDRLFTFEVLPKPVLYTVG